MLSQWVRAAQDFSGLSGAELARRMAERLGRSVDRSMINKMLNGVRRIGAEELIAISDITGYPPPEAESHFIQRIPLISWVNAGDLVQPDGVLEEDDCPVVETTGLSSGDWIALVVEGDSMDRISPPGSTIFVNRDDKRLVPNACYVIADEDGGASYKRYRPNPDRFEPVSVNSAHEAIFPAKPVQIVGRVRRSLLEM